MADFKPRSNVIWGILASFLAALIINKLKEWGYVAPAGSEAGIVDYLTSYLPYALGAAVAGAHDLLYKGIIPWLANRKAINTPKPPAP